MAVSDEDETWRRAGPGVKKERGREVGTVTRTEELQVREGV